MKREGKDNAIDSGSYDDIGAAMQMQNPSYADPTSAIWAWNLVGYIACICCLWNSNYVEPHRHSKRSYNSALGRSLSLSVRSERWKVRYPPPQVCLYLQCYPLANWYDSKTNKHTHSQQIHIQIRAERMLSKPFCSVYCLACHAKAIYCRFAPKIESGLCAFIDR